MGSVGSLGRTTKNGDDAAEAAKEDPQKVAVALESGRAGVLCGVLEQTAQLCNGLCSSSALLFFWCCLWTLVLEAIVSSYLKRTHNARFRVIPEPGPQLAKLFWRNISQVRNLTRDLNLQTRQAARKCLTDLGIKHQSRCG